MFRSGSGSANSGTVSGSLTLPHRSYLGKSGPARISPTWVNQGLLESLRLQGDIAKCLRMKKHI